MRSLFVMDPLDRLNIAGDSTFVTMRAMTDRGYPLATCTPAQLFAENGEAYAHCTPVRARDAAPHFETGTTVREALADFDVVWMRKDPPFDMDYIFTTYLLDLAAKRTLVINDPAGLKLYNEKMWVVAQWPHLQPPTLVTNRIPELKAFVAEAPGQSVLKPWDGNGGRGVIVTQKGDRNLGSVAELLTREGRDYVIAQHFIPEVVDGDRRILLFEGEVVGAMARIPQQGDFRANMHVGATVERCDLSARDRQICAEIGPALKRAGMTFVGIDVIGDYLTEINVTSPTGIREINRLYGLTLEEDLVDCVAARLLARRSP